MSAPPGALWILVAFATGVLVTRAVRAFARARGIVNHPNPIVPQHRQPIAYLGGLAIGITMAAVAAGARLGPASTPGLAPLRIAVPAALFLLLGTADDLRPLTAARKLLAQGLAAAVAVAMGLVWRLTGVAALDAAASLVWILVVVNAFNVTDVCDGLVAGLAIIALVFVGARGSETALPWVTTGACLGFLVFNRPPASIFLGDGGSHLLGFLVAATLIPSERAAGSAAAPAAWKDVAAAVLATGVTLFEVVLLVHARVRQGIPWWSGSPDHFSLRLQARGLTRLQTDALAWSAAASLCAIALLLPRLSDRLALAVLAATIVTMVPAWRALQRREA